MKEINCYTDWEFCSLCDEHLKGRIAIEIETMMTEGHDHIICFPCIEKLNSFLLKTKKKINFVPWFSADFPVSKKQKLKDNFTDDVLEYCVLEEVGFYKNGKRMPNLLKKLMEKTKVESEEYKLLERMFKSKVLNLIDRGLLIVDDDYKIKTRR